MADARFKFESFLFPDAAVGDVLLPADPQRVGVYLTSATGVMGVYVFLAADSGVPFLFRMTDDQTSAILWKDYGSLVQGRVTLNTNMALSPLYVGALTILDR